MTTNHDDPLVSPVTLTHLVSTAQLRRAERELSASQTRVHELERDAENGARLLKEYDNSLCTANQRIAELERELDLANAHAFRLLKERNAAKYGLVNPGYPYCSTCDLVLDPNERKCPRCDQDDERDKREWYRRQSRS